MNWKLKACSGLTLLTEGNNVVKALAYLYYQCYQHRWFQQIAVVALYQTKCKVRHMVNWNRKPWKVDDCEGTAAVILYCMLMCTAISCLSADVLNSKYIKVHFNGFVSEYSTYFISGIQCLSCSWWCVSSSSVWQRGLTKIQKSLCGVIVWCVLCFDSIEMRWLGNGKRARSGRKGWRHSRLSVETKTSRLRNWRRTMRCWDMLLTGLMSVAVDGYNWHLASETIPCPHMTYNVLVGR